MEPVPESPAQDTSAQLKEKPRMYPQFGNNNDLDNEASDINPWWERIISNRH